AVMFSYPAKGGIPRALALRDPLLHEVVNSLLRRRGGGEDLLAYRNGRGWHDVRAEDLNAAVKELVGERYSCKDLRTWNATVLAAVTLAAGTARGGVPKAERSPQARGEPRDRGGVDPPRQHPDGRPRLLRRPARHRAVRGGAHRAARAAAAGGRVVAAGPDRRRHARSGGAGGGAADRRLIEGSADPGWVS